MFKIVYGDTDGDGVADGTDNCLLNANAPQLDYDFDGEGDDCDLNDRMPQFVAFTREPGSDTVEISWEENTSESFNIYRGDLRVLRTTGQYTQDPSSPTVNRACGLPSNVTTVPSSSVPAPGEGAFYLVTVMSFWGGWESPLGFDSAGQQRPNDWPCY